jgi:hypothetical protein
VAGAGAGGGWVITREGGSGGKDGGTVSILIAHAYIHTAATMQGTMRG